MPPLKTERKRGLAKSAGNVVFGPPFAWICENLCGRPELDQLSKIKEGSVIRDTAGLLHVVGHGDDGVMGPEFVD